MILVVTGLGQAMLNPAIGDHPIIMGESDFLGVPLSFSYTVTLANMSF
jgi:hypothetical protein